MKFTGAEGGNLVHGMGLRVENLTQQRNRARTIPPKFSTISPNFGGRVPGGFHDRWHSGGLATPSQVHELAPWRVCAGSNRGGQRAPRVGRDVLGAPAGITHIKKGARRVRRPRPTSPNWAAPSLGNSEDASSVWLIFPPQGAWGVRSHRRGNAALAWGIGSLWREKEKAPSSRRTTNALRRHL